MSKTKAIEDLAKHLFEALPKPFQTAEKDLEKKFHKILQAGFSKLDLVTRQELDVQKSLLQRTREKLDALEKQIAELEKLASKKKG